MKNKLTKVISAVLAFLMIFGTVITNLGITKTYAADNVIKNISVDRSTIQHGEHFSLDVEFGGPGTKVADGQTERIDFSSSSNVKIKLPEKSIQLHDRNTGDNLGEVTFESNTATIKFNKTAAGLNDIQGGFHFSVTGHYLGNIQQEGSGSISITSGSMRKDVELINHQGGTSTSNVYRKEGVWDSGDPKGNRVDWRFIFNAAHKPAYGKEIQFVVKDKLADTMEWDMDTIEGSKYVLQYRGQWMSLEDARKKNFGIRFNGQDVEITIPAYVLGDGVNWTAPLDQDEVSVSLTARVKEAVMKNPTIKYVENTSIPELSGKQIDDWKLNEKENSAKVEIIRQGGWIQGTVPGELKIKKVIRGKTVPIKGVEFTLERKDKAEFEAKDGEEIKRGTSIKLVTNADGIINVKELRPGDYIVKETNAPEWLDNNSTKIVREFTISDKDTKGTEFTIENEKKRGGAVTKKWVDHEGMPLLKHPAIEIQLYQNGKPFDKVILDEDEQVYTWDDLEVADDTGKPYEYTVKEVGEKDGFVTIGKNKYQVIYTPNGIDGDDGSKMFFIIENRLTPPEIKETINIPVEKKWIGEHLSDSVKVKLFANDKEVASKDLNENNHWKATFEKQPKTDDNGKEIKYSVKEEMNHWESDNFENKVIGDAEKGFVVTNTNIATRDISVYKFWDAPPMIPSGLPFDNNLGMLPPLGNPGDMNPSISESITVHLFGDGKEVASAKITKADATGFSPNAWGHTFKDLPIYDKTDGHKIEYTIKEDKIDGYKMEIKKVDDWAFTIINKSIVDIPVKKVWVGKKGQSATVHLYREYTTEEYDAENDEWKDVLKTEEVAAVELNENNGWNHVFKEVEKFPFGEFGTLNNLRYYVKEDPVAGYETKVTGDIEKGFVVTNTSKDIQPDKISIPVKKEWKDIKDNGIIAPVDKIKVQLFKNSVKEGEPKEITKDNGWKLTFEKLPVSEKVGSKNHEYTVKEVDDSGAIIEDGGSIKFNGKWYEVIVKGSMKDGFTITNKEKTPWTPMIPATRDIKITKDWKAANGDKLNSSIEKVEVELYKDGTATGKRLELNKQNNWSGTFEKLAVSEKLNSKIYEYTVKEVGESNNTIRLDGKWFKVEVTGSMKDGFTVTNKEIPSQTPLEPATTSLKVEKEWQGIAPKDAPEVTVYLVKNGVKTDKFIKLNKNNNWSGVFKDLKAVDDIKSDKANTYTVVEDGEKDGKITLSGVEYRVTYAGGKIINTKVIPQTPLTPSTTSFKVEKEWKGVNPKDAPEVIIYLVKNGVKTDKFIKLNKDNNWKGEFKDLKAVDDIKDKKANVYTIVEDGEKDGKITLSGKEYKVTYVGGKVVNTKVEKPIPKDPKVPEQKTPDKQGNIKSLPNTGDGHNPQLYAGLLAISGALLLAIGLLKKHKMKEEK